MAWITVLGSATRTDGGYNGAFDRAGGYKFPKQDTPTHRYFDTSSEPPSVANLSRSLTINGTTAQPTFWYKGQDTVAPNWPAEVGGADGLLTEAGSGASPSYAQGVPLMGSDASVKYNAAKGHQAAGTSFADVTLEDMIVEVVVKLPTVFVNDVRIIDKRGSAGNGWLLNTATGTVRLYIVDEDGLSYAATGALTNGSWYHLICFVDRSGYARFCVNGVAGTVSDVSGTEKTLASDDKLSFGVRGDLAAQWGGAIVQAAFWKASSWFPSDAAGLAAQEVLAAQRFRALTGLRPQASAAGVDTAPITAARNCVATLEKYNTATSAVEYYTVGENWLPVGSRWDATLGKVVMEYKPSLAVENKFLQSENMATTWAKLDAGDTITATTFIADSTDGDHGVSQAVTLTAASWVVMVEATKGNKNWLYISDDTVANCTGYFDLNTPAAGTFGAGATGGIVTRGDRVLCWMTLTGTVAAHTFKIQSADADGDKSIVGNGALVNTTIHRTMLHLGTYPRTYVATTTAAKTRAKDELEYTVTGPGAQGAIVFDLNVRACDVATACTLVDVSDGGATNRAFVNLIAAGDVLTANIGADGLVTGTTDVADGVTRRVCMTWKPGRVELWIAGVQEGTADVSYTASAAMNQCAIGMAYDNSAQPSTPTGVRGVKLFNRFVNGAQLSGGLS